MGIDGAVVEAGLEVFPKPGLFDETHLALGTSKVHDGL
jgi:hypothetical protein